MGATASRFNTESSISAAMGGFDRRMDEWKNQADLAGRLSLVAEALLQFLLLESDVDDVGLTEGEVQELLGGRE